MIKKRMRRIDRLEEQTRRKGKKKKEVDKEDENVRAKMAIVPVRKNLYRVYS